MNGCAAPPVRTLGRWGLLLPPVPPCVALAESPVTSRRAGPAFISPGARGSQCSSVRRSGGVPVTSAKLSGQRKRARSSPKASGLHRTPPDLHRSRSRRCVMALPPPALLLVGFVLVSADRVRDRREGRKDTAPLCHARAARYYAPLLPHRRSSVRFPSCSPRGGPVSGPVLTACCLSVAGPDRRQRR